MTRPLIDDYPYLDAHTLWLAHVTPAGLRCGAGGTGRFERDWTDHLRRRRTNYFEISLAGCRYGGVRAYFICPAETCERRCTRLYAIGDRWLCRKCHGLSYQTQRLHKARRLLYRKHKVLRRVGGVGAGGYPKDKPKGMHERTYYRLWEEADNYENRAFSHFMKGRGLG